MYVNKMIVDQVALGNEVAEAAETLDSRDVRDVRFRLGTDTDGEAAIFFAVLLTPYGSQPSRLAAVTGKVSAALFDRLQPYNRWGLQALF